MQSLARGHIAAQHRAGAWQNYAQEAKFFVLACWKELFPTGSSLQHGTSEVEHCRTLHSRCAPAAIRPGDKGVNVCAAAAAAHDATRIDADDWQVLRLRHWVHDQSCRQLKPCAHRLQAQEQKFSLPPVFMAMSCWTME